MVAYKGQQTLLTRGIFIRGEVIMLEHNARIYYSSIVLAFCKQIIKEN